MADALLPHEEHMLERAYSLAGALLDKARRQDIPSEVMAGALLSTLAEALVGGLGRDGSEEILLRLIARIRDGEFDPETDRSDEVF